MEKAAACEPRRGRAVLANVAIDDAAGQDVMMNPTGQERPSILRAARRHACEVDPRFLRWEADQGLDIELPHAGQADGEFSLDPLLRAAHAGKATACSTSTNTGYPSAHLRLAGRPWPWRPTTPFALTIAAAIGGALLPAAAARRRRP